MGLGKTQGPAIVKSLPDEGFSPDLNCLMVAGMRDLIRKT